MRLPALLSIFLLLALCFPHCSLAGESTEHCLRIRRPTPYPVHFTSYAAGISIRWWRQFKNPSFCPYVLCASSCAYVCAYPRLGSLTQEELFYADITPCSLDAPDCSSCCLSTSLDKARESLHGKESSDSKEQSGIPASCCDSYTKTGNNSSTAGKTGKPD
jgi:hypothetical protein